MRWGLLLSFVALAACSSGEPPQGVTRESGTRGGTTSGGFTETSPTRHRGPSTERSAISLTVSGASTTTSEASSTASSTSTTTGHSTIRSSSVATSTATATTTATQRISGCVTIALPIPATITVKSPTGAAIVDALFTVAGVDAGTRLAGELYVDAGVPTGTYSVAGNPYAGPYLQAGTYTVEISAPGYQTLTVPDVAIGAESGCKDALKASVITVTLVPADAGTDAGSHASSSG